MATVILDQDLKTLRTKPFWPREFGSQPETEDEDFDPFLEGNPNHRTLAQTDSESEDEESEEEEEEEED